MSKNRIGYALIVVVTLVAFVVARRNYLATTSEPGIVTIRFGHFLIDPAFRRFIDRAAEAYARLHPEVRVKQLDIPQQVYMQWQRTQIVGETAPEIMQFAYFNPAIEEMVMQHFIVLNDWVEQPNPYRTDAASQTMSWRDTFVDGLNSRDAYSEKLRAYFGIPLLMGGYRFFYNETMRAEIGEPVGPWTFQEFRQVAERLKATGQVDMSGRPVTPIVASNFSSYSTFKMLFSSVTQPLLFSLDRNCDLLVNGRDTAMGFLEGRWSYRSEEVQAALRLIKEGSELMNAGFSQLHKQDGILQFLQGRGLAMGGAHIDLTLLNEMASFKVGETGFPVPDAEDPVYGRYVLGPVNERSGSSTLALGVLRSPQQNRAVDFLQFLTGTEMTALLRKETGWRVSVSDPRTDEKLNLQEGYPETLFDYMNTQGSLLSYQQNAHMLFRSDLGPVVFAEKMAMDAPREQQVWLSAQATMLRQTLRQQEAAIMAHWALSQVEGADEKEVRMLDEFLEVNNRQEADFRRMARFLIRHVDR